MLPCIPGAPALPELLASGKHEQDEREDEVDAWRRQESGVSGMAVGAMDVGGAGKWAGCCRGERGQVLAVEWEQKGAKVGRCRKVSREQRVVEVTTGMKCDDAALCS